MVADEVCGIASARPGYVRVAVDGVDGAGKTYFADELADALRARDLAVVRVSLDGFHRPREERYRRGRTDPEGFYRDSYDYDRFRTLVLEPFERDGSGTYVHAIHDVDAERPLDAQPLQALPDAILIVDGIFAHRDELVASWDYSVWLEVPFAISIPRGAQRGFGDPDPDAPSNRRYVEGQRLYVAECAPRERASVAIDNSDLDDPRLL